MLSAPPELDPSASYSWAHRAGCLCSSPRPQRAPDPPALVPAPGNSPSNTNPHANIPSLAKRCQSGHLALIIIAPCVEYAISPSCARSAEFSNGSCRGWKAHTSSEYTCRAGISNPLIPVEERKKNMTLNRVTRGLFHLASDLLLPLLHRAAHSRQCSIGYIAAPGVKYTSCASWFQTRIRRGKCFLPVMNSEMRNSKSGSMSGRLARSCAKDPDQTAF